MKLLNLTMLSLVGTSLLRSSSAFGPAAFSRTSASANATQRNMFNRLFGANTISSEYPIMAEESAMSQKGHGTSEAPVQKELRWNCDNETADRICNFNRHYAEFGGYWESTTFLKSEKGDEPINFYDSVTGELLFKAPIGRTMDEFVKESKSHGWPSFRDEEVVWDHVRCLKNGECISDSGTHLGHNLPDGSGNRYCINLVSVAGNSKDE